MQTDDTQSEWTVLAARRELTLQRKHESRVVARLFHSMISQVERESTRPISVQTRA